MSEKIEKLKMPEKLGFSALSAAMNIIYNMRSTYYMIFLTNVLELTAQEAGTIVSLGVTWDAINDPLIALFTNNRKFKTGEKIRPYALWCALPYAVSAGLIFTNLGLSHKATLVACVLIYFLFEIFNTFVSIPYNCMGSLATNVDSDRRSINMFRQFGALIGTALGTLCIPKLISLFGGFKQVDYLTKSDSKALIFTMITLGIICLFGCLAHYFTTKERVKQISDNEDKITLIEAYKLLLSCKSWVFNMLYILGYGVINSFMMTNITYYASYILGSTRASMPIMATYLVFALITSLSAGVIDTKLGRKKTMIFACIIQVIGKIPFIIDPYWSLSIYVNATTTGIGATLTFIMFNTNRNNIVDIIEYKNDKRIDSLAGAGDNLISKIAEAISSKTIGAILGSAGFAVGLGLSQPEKVFSSINMMLGIVPAVVAVFMTIAVSLMDINKEYKQAKANYENRASN